MAAGTFNFGISKHANGWSVTLDERAASGFDWEKNFYVFETWDKCEAFVLSSLRGRRDAILGREAARKNGEVTT